MSEDYEGKELPALISNSFDDNNEVKTTEEDPDAAPATLAEKIGTGEKSHSTTGLAAPRRNFPFVSSIDRSRSAVNVFKDQNPDTGLPNLFDKDCDHCVNETRHWHSYVSVNKPEEGALPPNPGFNSDPIYTKASVAYNKFQEELPTLLENYDTEHAAYKDALKAHNKALETGNESEEPTAPEYPQAPEEAKAIRPKSEKRKLRGVLQMAQLASKTRAIYDNQEVSQQLDAEGNPINIRIMSPEEQAAAKARSAANIAAGRNPRFIPTGKIKGK